MRIFITGGTGFIGRHLCRAWLAEGHEITVLSRQSPRRVVSLCGAVRAVESLERMGEPEVVVNLAGEPILGRRWTAARKRAIWESRVTLTERLVQRLDALTTRPRVLLSGSAVGYYGDRGDQVLTEEASPGNGFGAELCVAWEAAALEAERLGVRVCLLRTGPVLGAGGGMLARMLPPFRVGLGGPLGRGRQWLAWIHLQDHLRAMRYLVDHETLEGPFNLTAPNPVTSSELAAALGRVLHRPAVLPFPASLLRLMLGEQAEILLGSQRAVPARLQEAGFRFDYPELEMALREILSG
jgi:uncharacterized protein (TIGR01777 family)